MHATNYYRRLKEDCEGQFLANFNKAFPLDAVIYEDLLNWDDAAQKFILPNGGRILDTKLQFLPEIVRLPYERVIVEYTMKGFDGGPAERAYGKDAVLCSKRIAFAQQLDDKAILVHCAAFFDDMGEWSFTPFSAIVHTGVEQSKLEKPKHYEGLGEFANQLMIPNTGIQIIPHTCVAKLESRSELEKRGMIDTGDEVCAVLSLIEALSCSNVHTENLPVQPLCKKAIKRGDKPFDEYKVLTVRTHGSHSTGSVEHTGGHASPREHLRRGHIRRHPTAGNIWINSMVVNAGVGAKVHKTYKLEAA